MIVPPPTDVTIARPGWFDECRVEIGPPTCAWRTDGPGSFDCEVSTRALLECGLNLHQISDALKGRWLWWEHPTAGPWGGVITRTEVGTWFTRITAEQFAVLLRKRSLAVHAAAVGTSPGSLALYYLTSTARAGDAFLLTGWEAEESGEAVSIEPRGGDLCDDVLPQLADFGYQWRIRADTKSERLFQFRKRLGIDKRGSLLLCEGHHIPNGGFRTTGDLWTVANSITGIAGDRRFDETTGYQQDDEASMRALGRRYEETLAYTGHVTRSTIAPLVKRDLAIYRYPQEIAEVTVVDEDYCFADFREGDVVSVLSEHANWQGPMDIDIRSYDGRANTITFAGRLRTDGS